MHFSLITRIHGCVNQGMNLLTTTLSDSLMEFGLPVSTTLGSARLEALVAREELLPSESTVEFP